MLGLFSDIYRSNLPIIAHRLYTSWLKNKLTDRLGEKFNSDWQLGSIVWVPMGEVGA
jgi:hypothetical protein